MKLELGRGRQSGVVLACAVLAAYGVLTALIKWSPFQLLVGNDSLMIRGMSVDGVSRTLATTTSNGMGWGLIVALLVLGGSFFDLNRRLGIRLHRLPAVLLFVLCVQFAGGFLGYGYGVIASASQYSLAPKTDSGHYSGQPHEWYDYTAGIKGMNLLYDKSRVSGDDSAFEAANFWNVYLGIASLGISRWSAAIRVHESSSMAQEQTAVGRELGVCVLLLIVAIWRFKYRGKHVKT